MSLYALPKRRTDDSSVLDMAEHHTKLYLTEGGVKRIRRTSDGKVEKQFRLVLGDLPVAYTSEQNGKVLYIMKDSVKEYTPKDVTYGERNLPPCIQVIEEGRNVQLLLSVSTTGIKSKIGIYNIFDSRLKVKVKPFVPFRRLSLFLCRAASTLFTKPFRNTFFFFFFLSLILMVVARKREKSSWKCSRRFVASNFSINFFPSLSLSLTLLQKKKTDTRVSTPKTFLK